MSRALGRVADVRASSSVIERAVSLYVAAYGVDLSEAEMPAEGYESFDAFFTRALKPGRRPLDADPSAVLSPADGKVHACGRIESDSTFRVKGTTYGVGDMLGDEGEAQRYEGGVFAVIYLSPRDYHRVHAPVSAPVRAVRHVPGTLFPVNAIGEHVRQLFARNERVVVQQRSEAFGDVATILVGAVGVGRISVAFEPAVRTNDGRVEVYRRYGADGPVLARGDELGTFHLGSTVVLFLAPTAQCALGVAGGDTVRMGQALARRSESR